MIPVVYPVIHPIIRTIFAKESGVERLEMRACLLDNPYKIGVILAVRVTGRVACKQMVPKDERTID